ncbi:hypothetical protein PAAG_02094 [Paracoccidioides lutzii Pb01]|uniref:Uncharacterized protein n=1 Tax=Paracoccidioides lutzii (strain ATCC MYA-826 / Pb01) TaxID=502779 RepID=C1GU99_PARBA|nr:hypothetical protein PAAG_02094 [Paracoccidioides lutzii Pb01]EEH39906.2 hypothetical protein PAAG_02094 [Paracoccidioides lutzii Pb01]
MDLDRTVLSRILLQAPRKPIMAMLDTKSPLKTFETVNPSSPLITTLFKSFKTSRLQRSLLLQTKRIGNVRARDEDIVGIEHRYSNLTGETAGIKHNESQQWYCWSGMANDERLLLKCSDSKDVKGKRVPHTAFVDPGTPPGAPGRESIEVRALVFG